jgi:hypothetical protein
MQYEMQLFEYEEETQFRVIDRDGEPWFVISEVCRELEVNNVSDAAARLDDDEKDNIDIIDAIGRSRKTLIINESGLYSLIRQRAKDGYINATAMCKAAERRWSHYAENASTKSFVKVLASKTGIPASTLIQSLTGGDVRLQGTWVHPQVAIHYKAAYMRSAGRPHQVRYRLPAGVYVCHVSLPLQHQPRSIGFHRAGRVVPSPLRIPARKMQTPRTEPTQSWSWR